MKAVLLAAVSTAALALSTPAALAQPAGPTDSPKVDNLERLSTFRQTGTAEPAPINQAGRRADAIRRNLERVKLPDGFRIDLYALVPDARHMAVGPNAGVVFVGTRKTKVYAVTDRDKDRIADEVKEFAPSVAFKIPNGVCFSRDGMLYVAEQNRVLVFPAAEFFYEGPDVAAFNVVKQGELIPPAEESYNHTARVCRVGPDGKLYISLGQPYNVPPKEKMDLYNRVGIGGMIRIDQDGKNREVYARGIRNSVGHDFNPADRTLWFTDNQVDGMGDDQPPGEINRIAQAGQHSASVLRRRHHAHDGVQGRPRAGGRDQPAGGTWRTRPTSDGVLRGQMFPEQYRGGIFSAQHGSWNRTTAVGARVMFTSLKPTGRRTRRCLSRKAG
jgi:glucose/arabinose dehydrogenase